MRAGGRPPTDLMAGRRSFFDGRAVHRPRESARYYHRLIERYYTFLVPPGARVLEVGCGLGDLLAAVQPAKGVGVDSSKAVIVLAQARHPELQFLVADALEISDGDPFDYILLSDLVNDLPDVQGVLVHLRRAAHPRTRLVMNFVNNLWHPALFVAEKLGAKAPALSQNWLSLTDMMNLCHLAGWEVVKTDARILWPLRTPVVATVLNRWLAPLLRHLCLTMFVVARPRRTAPDGQHYRCSVVVPARNEAGNIEAAVLRTPEMGLGTEIIFIEGGSTDRRRSSNGSRRAIRSGTAN